MSMNGPFYFKNTIDLGEGHPSGIRYVSADMGSDGGWKSPYRWTHPTESTTGDGGKTGIFNGIDYMLYHNLYTLLFNDQSTFEDDLGCNCNEPTVSFPSLDNDGKYPIYNALSVGQQYIQAKESVKDQIEYLYYCDNDVLAEVNHQVTGAFTIGPKFPNYVDYGITTTRYQTSDAVVKNGGVLTVNNRLIMCNSTI